MRASFSVILNPCIVWGLESFSQPSSAAELQSDSHNEGSLQTSLCGRLQFSDIVNASHIQGAWDASL